VDGRLDEDRLDLDVLDAVAGLFAELIALGEQVAQDFEVPAFFMKALHMIDGPLAMKELGRRPSETSYVESWIFNSNKCFAVYSP